MGTNINLSLKVEHLQITIDQIIFISTHRTVPVVPRFQAEEIAGRAQVPTVGQRQQEQNKHV